MEPSKEECALGIGQSSNDAAVKDVEMQLRKEECVGSMEQSSNDVAAKDVQMEPSKEECAEGMEQCRQHKQQCRSIVFEGKLYMFGYLGSWSDI